MNLIRELFLNPKKLALMVAGFFISIYTFSMGVSFFQSNINFRNELANLMDSTIRLESNGYSEIEAKQEDFIDTLIDNKEGFLTDNNSVRHGNYGFLLMGVYDFKDIGKIFPIYDGRCFTVDEMNSDKKIAMVGKYTSEVTYKRDGRSYIEILGEEYEVIGTIGKKVSSYFDTHIILPVKAIPQEVLKMKWSGNPLYIDKALLNDSNYKENLTKSLNKLGIEGVYFEENDEVNPIQESFESQEAKLLSFVMMVSLSVVSLMIFSTLWIKESERQMAIKKILGASNFSLIKEVLSQFIVMAILGLIISSTFYSLSLNMLSEVLNEPMVFNLSTIILAFIFSILIAVLNTCLSYLDIIRFKNIKEAG